MLHFFPLLLLDLPPFVGFVQYHFYSFFFVNFQFCLEKSYGFNKVGDLDSFDFFISCEWLENICLSKENVQAEPREQNEDIHQ